MSPYEPKKIEEKWQKFWEDEGSFSASNNGKDKRYVLIEFPYPSGTGLHMGHLRPYVAGDITARHLRMKGHEVLYPIGWDAFGLPAENFAIKTGEHPSKTTEENISNAKKQLISWGISFDWQREVNTTDPEYYKWTQWIFLQFFKAGLAYEAFGKINWCPKDKTGLADEEVIDGKCERCGTKVEKKEMRQWYLKITQYAEKLLDGLEGLNWPEEVKTQQRNWIGKSEGAEISFPLVETRESIKVFTTRPDTLFGATYLVLSPEHPLIQSLKPFIKNSKEVQEYINAAVSKAELERISQEKEKSGVALEGISAINPATQKSVPIWVADYVLGSYGTGAIMAVPAHDERDYMFARQHELPVIRVIEGGETPYAGEGEIVRSGSFNGMQSHEARAAITSAVGANKSVRYKLRDWVFSRQRYWGEPIPLIHCEKCGVVPVPEEELPVELPRVEKYEPTGTGESPLNAIDDWVNTKCPSCGGQGKRETNTMPQWAGSSWYYLRYTDPKNNKRFAGEKEIESWLPVDTYFGGHEHTTLHLLYSRFWNIFLYDQGHIPFSEPYTKRVPHGIVLGPDGEKMSKSRGNVVDPQDIVQRFGADTLRLYEPFLGPHGATVKWDDRGIMGAFRFLTKAWKLHSTVVVSEPSTSLLHAVHSSILKVEKDIETYSFNTAVSTLMILISHLEKEPNKDAFKVFVLLLFPFAPHISAELWEKCGFEGYVWEQEWPKADSKYSSPQTVTIAVQVDGRLRETMVVSTGLSEKEIMEQALGKENVKKYITGKTKIIFVPDRLINFVNA